MGRKLMRAKYNAEKLIYEAWQGVHRTSHKNLFRALGMLMDLIEKEQNNKFAQLKNPESKEANSTKTPKE